MNGIFFAIILIAFVVAGYRQITWAPPSVPSGAVDALSPMQALATGMVDTAASSVTLAIGLIGVMAFFLGLMKVAEEGGMLRVIAKTIRPLMVRLFPDVPANHPAMGAMIMNMSANALGLGNAATPFGIRAMQELDKLNPCKGTATNSMALFLAINTSSVTLLPTGVIALRAAAGSTDPAGILPTTLFATVISTTIAIAMCLVLRRHWATAEDVTPAEDMVSLDTQNAEEGEALPDEADDSYPAWISAAALLTIAALIPITILYGKIISPWIIPGLTVALLGFGVAKKVRVYEAFVEGRERRL